MEMKASMCQDRGKSDPYFDVGDTPAGNSVKIQCDGCLPPHFCQI